MESANNEITMETSNASPIAMDEKHDKDEPDMDPHKTRRALAGRQYSRKYRMKQMQYIVYLESEVKALQAEVEIAAPRIKHVSYQNSLLRVENCCYKQRLSAYSNELMFKEAQCGELKREREVLKQLYEVKRQQLAEMFRAAIPSQDDPKYPPNC